MISRKNHHLLLLLLALALVLVIHSTLAANEPPFRFDGNPISFRPTPGSDSPTTDGSNGSSLVWQPLRATFRPLNRQSPPSPPPAPLPPTPPVAPLPPSSPFEPSTSDSAAESSFENLGASSTDPSAFETSSFSRLPFPSARSAATTTIATATTTTTSTTTTSRPATSAQPNLDEEEQPTRVPLSRFRPTKAPSIDPQAQPSTNVFTSTAASGSGGGGGGGGGGANKTNYQMSQDCFECICEASTNCNTNSRCQTSDVRHTRCGMFLISYDQWLASNLSRELVTREALDKDPAADERAFYECVTQRDCAERLLSIYMAKNGRDCDKDGRVDCYDLAAIHQAGVQQCASESLLESQYWSDFNACFGFGR